MSAFGWRSRPGFMCGFCVVWQVGWPRCSGRFLRSARTARSAGKSHGWSCSGSGFQTRVLSRRFWSMAGGLILLMLRMWFGVCLVCWCCLLLGDEGFGAAGSFAGMGQCFWVGLLSLERAVLDLRSQLGVARSLGPLRLSHFWCPSMFCFVLCGPRN